MLDRNQPDSTSEHRLEALIQLLDEKGIISKEEIWKLLQRTVEEKTRAETSEIKEWKDLMRELDVRMPRKIEDIYDALISYGMPLENFPPFVQEAYKAKKAARSKKPSWDVIK